MSKEIEKGIELLNEAADIRIAISGMYDRYTALTVFMQTLTENVKPKDVKNAVDAIHYFGGVGYPHPNSPGRMEDLLDKMVGMYRVLSFIGRGKMVEDHLAKYGVTLKYEGFFKLEDHDLDKDDKQGLQRVCTALGLQMPRDVKKTSDVFRFVIDTLNGIQTNICQSSNKIRKVIKPRVIKEVGLEREEFKRSLQAVRLKKSERVERATTRRKVSTGSYKKFLEISKTVEGVKKPSYHDDD